MGAHLRGPLAAVPIIRRCTLAELGWSAASENLHSDLARGVLRRVESLDPWGWITIIPHKSPMEA